MDTGDGRVGLGGGGVVGGHWGVTDGGGASTGFAGGGRSGGRGYTVQVGCCGHDTNTIGLIVGGMRGMGGGPSCIDGRGSTISPDPRVGGRPSGVGTREGVPIVAGCDGREKPGSLAGKRSCSDWCGGVISIESFALAAAVNGVPSAQ